MDHLLYLSVKAQEKLGETGQAVAKSVQFGPRAVYNGETNHEAIMRELHEALATIEMLFEAEHGDGASVDILAMLSKRSIKFAREKIIRNHPVLARRFDINQCMSPLTKHITQDIGFDEKQLSTFGELNLAADLGFCLKRINFPFTEIKHQKYLDFVLEYDSQSVRCVLPVGQMVDFGRKYIRPCVNDISFGYHTETKEEFGTVKYRKGTLKSLHINGFDWFSYLYMLSSDFTYRIKKSFLSMTNTGTIVLVMDFTVENGKKDLTDFMYDHFPDNDSEAAKLP